MRVFIGRSRYPRCHCGAEGRTRETFAKRRAGDHGPAVDTTTLTLVRHHLLLLGFVALVAACGGAGASDGGAPATTTATTAPVVTSAAPTGTDAARAPADAPAALGFSAPLVGGGEIELGSLAGRPVLLWFWAPW